MHAAVFALILFAFGLWAWRWQDAVCLAAVGGVCAYGMTLPRRSNALLLFALVTVIVALNVHRWVG